MRTKTKYNKVVNFDEDTKEITVLDYTFDDTMHGKPFRGATGHIFEPISKEEYNDRMDEDNVIEYLIDSGIELPEQYKRGGFQELYEAMESNNELQDFVFDTSYSEMWDEIREVLNLNKDEAYIFTYSGGGRCFDKDFQGNINPELSAVIREFES